jgi:quercetin dioxygenase-like cupin family protein
MQSLRLTPIADQGLEISNLELRMSKASGVIDPEPFRARARGEGDPLAEYFALSKGMRSIHLPLGHDAPLFEDDSPVLTFVISGEVEIEASNYGKVEMHPGDIFLAEVGTPEQFVTAKGDCRLIQLLVEPDWPGDRTKPVNPSSDHARGSHELNCKRMVKGADDKSYFHDFGSLFAEPSKWSEITPLVGFRFIAMAEDTFIDWHPEIVNNVVIVMSGALELEVGGGEGAVEIFRQGDVCLAEDRTGEGHIDRMHGTVQVAVLIVDDQALWPMTN